MSSLSQRIMDHAAALPEATPICPKALLHLGSRAAVDKALSRLVRSERLLRVWRGVYVRTIETRFGVRGPEPEKVVAELAELWSETIVPCGGAAANYLGLTTQNPMVTVYLTSGPSRRLRFGAREVRMRHAPRWQLVAPHTRWGAAVRAMEYFGPREIDDAVAAVASKLSADEMTGLLATRAVLPTWMAEPLSALAADG